MNKWEKEWQSDLERMKERKNKATHKENGKK